jgi:hypothetical protein
MSRYLVKKLESIISLMKIPGGGTPTSLRKFSHRRRLKKFVASLYARIRKVII